MQDDHLQARARLDSDRHFELPLAVREVPSGPGRRPDTEVESEVSAPAPPRETGSMFQRRWEDVQTLFVARGGRGRPRPG